MQIMVNRRRALNAPTLNDIARAVGVSRTTVSNAFNRPDQLSPELRDKVLSAAQQLGYAGPNPVARILRTGRADAIGLVFGDSLPYAVDDPAALGFLRGVSQVCQESNTGLLMLSAMDVDTAEKTIMRAAIDGVILYSMPHPSKVVERVLERRLPTVNVDQALLQHVPSVTIDDRGAARRLAEHLLALGHRRLGILTMGARDEKRALSKVSAASLVPCSPCEDRIMGYLDAVHAIDNTTGDSGDDSGAGNEADVDETADNGIARESDVPVWNCGPNDEDAAMAAALQILRRPDRPTAILATSDRVAIGILRAAERLSLGVPDDLSVVGFDDIPSAEHVRPALTTMRQPLFDKGVIAARMLLLEDEPSEDHTLTTELVVRASSGPAPSEVKLVYS